MSNRSLGSGGAGKIKSKIKKELVGSQFSTTSDDIWMKTWGNYDSDNMFDQSKEAEMSVSDPEEYLVSRSDEDVIFSSHNVRIEQESSAVTLNSEHNLLDREEDDYVTSIEFNECTERGLFCRETTELLPVIHYHCPCCVKHSEASILAIEEHYKLCIATMTNSNALFTSICKHDDYITFYECRSSDPECPASDLKLPIHYHCPCCLIFTQQNLAQVVRHQLMCCKSLTTLTPIPAEEEEEEEERGGIDHSLGTDLTESLCTHDEEVVRYRICYNTDSLYCHVDEGRGKKKIHFHCMCCNIFSDNKLRSIRKHQKMCCQYQSGGDAPPCKVLFLFEISAALQQYYSITSIQNRKRQTTDPMSILAPQRKLAKKSSVVIAEIDDALFTKCVGQSPVCGTSEQNRTSHYHCPICKVFTARKLPRIKLHYNKCMRPGQRPKPRGTPLDLQCELVDKLNRIFLVRACSSGPGVPTHCIYRAGPASNQMHCEDGCQIDKKLGKIKCKHLETCEQLVRSAEQVSESGPEIPIFSDISLFYNFPEETKGQICHIYQQCAEFRVPIIRPYYPRIASNKPVYTYYSISTCTTPKYYSKSGRVLVTYNERTQTFKCKCNDVNCVHLLVAQMYQSHVSGAGPQSGKVSNVSPECHSEYFIGPC